MRVVEFEGIIELGDGLLDAVAFGILQCRVEVRFCLVGDQPQHRQIFLAVIALIALIAVFGSAKGTLHIGSRGFRKKWAGRLRPAAYQIGTPRRLKTTRPKGSANSCSEN